MYEFVTGTTHVRLDLIQWSYKFRKNNYTFLMAIFRSIVWSCLLALLGTCKPVSGCEYTCIDQGSWAIGAAIGSGRMDNPLYGGDDKQLSWIPSFYYYGQQFYLENTQMGYTLTENDNWSFDLHGQLNKDGLYFNDTGFDALLIAGSGQPGNVDSPEDETPFFPIDHNRVDRDFSYFAGAKLSHFYNEQVNFSAYLHQDITGVTQGHTAGLMASFYYPVKNWRFQASVQLDYRSGQVNQYYYGLSKNEIGEYLDGFTVGSGINQGLNLSASYIINKNLSLIATYSFKKFASALHASPLLEHKHIDFYFVGFSYQFGSE